MAISSLSRFFPGISIRINRAHRHDYLLIGRLLRGMAQFKRHFTGRYLARGTGKPDLLGMGDEDPGGPEIGKGCKPDEAIYGTRVMNGGQHFEQGTEDYPKFGVENIYSDEITRTVDC